MKLRLFAICTTGTLIVAFLGTSSCNEDDAPIPGCLVKTAAISITGNLVEFSYNYSDQRKIQSGTLTVTYTGGKDEYTFAAEANGLIQHVVYAGTTIPSIDFSYNSKSQLIEQLSYVDGAPFFKYAFEYDAFDRLIKKVEYQYSAPNATYVLWLSTTYEYANQTALNPESAEAIRANGSPAYSFTYEYDDKKIPMEGLPFLFSGTINNVTHATEVRHSLNATFKTDITYQYNSQGYPTQAVAVSETTGSPQTATYTYTYDCK